MSLSSDLEAKFFNHLLTGLVKKNFEGDSNYSYDVLKSQLFSGSAMTPEGIQSYILAVEATVQKAGHDDLDGAGLNALLAESTISKEHAEVFLRFWNSERAKVHAALVSRTVWNSSLKSFAWRIDVKTTTKAALAKQGAPGVFQTEPTAIVEMSLDKPAGSRDVVHFEMDRATVASALAKITQLEALIATSTGSAS